MRHAQRESQTTSPVRRAQHGDKTMAPKSEQQSVWVITHSGKYAWEWNSHKRVEFNTEFTADDFIKAGNVIGSDDRGKGQANVWD